ncbi:hypothetical protein MINTM008_52200 [Mycobacterium intracellulare]|uniref:Uncharacterized protein n=1 Tax=Mycobacterium intracellulare TaxID=1767 RepID=A0A7R7MZ26_MYCIT|nr:hypothetical protein MINTM005_50370 [Mycobacterium intracellulare]BCP12832.1 hypothetical protein MINTM020_49300 [Mycobacterium paraintracellulare]BCP39645.1 hypothetical protein MINTMi198_50150 [Mycobacterium intracellulare M.i.198]BCO65058.1 hypothetical protein MINTM006_50080 [Mycobacterium intracellulare]BCO75885.1 hypothetical protein MINTM008_52200 [Mycobacterium intracellulare]
MREDPIAGFAVVSVVGGRVAALFGVDDIFFGRWLGARALGHGPIVAPGKDGRMAG